MNPLTLKSTLAHEIQHAIQVREGFAWGDSFTITSGAPEIQNSRDEVKELIGFLMPTGIPDGLFYDLENIGKKSFVSLLKEILARAPGWKMFPAMTDWAALKENPEAVSCGKCFGTQKSIE